MRCTPGAGCRRQKGSDMLKVIRTFDLPEHEKPGGFDHAAVYRKSNRLYVAHTANDALDVIDCATDSYLYSIPGMTGVAGVLAGNEEDLVFTSNRGEDSIGVFSPDDEASFFKVQVGRRPNGLAYDFRRRHLLAANVGDPAAGRPPSFSIVDMERREMIADIPAPGRTRWALYDQEGDRFYVNIYDPAVIAVIDAGNLSPDFTTITVPATGPHGLDKGKDCLYCACDSKVLVKIDLVSRRTLSRHDLSGAPDVIFWNENLHHLYVASGDPGAIDVFDTETMKLVQTASTEKGAHTIGYAPDLGKVYAFLPQSHAAEVFVDG